MKKTIVIILMFIAVLFSSFFMTEKNVYAALYTSKINSFETAQNELIEVVKNTDATSKKDKTKILNSLKKARLQLKSVDFWLRYLDPLAYKKINAPLPVEWETEVFEKYEKPYQRKGAGLTLAELYLEESSPNKDTLIALLEATLGAIKTFQADSTTQILAKPSHFYFCNRLFLLNLAAIYTTGFECPNSENIIPELRAMLHSNKEIYTAFNQSFPNKSLPESYLTLFDKAISFLDAQPDDFEKFDHFTFIQQFVNPLFIENQSCIKNYKVYSKSWNDYSLNDDATSIFDKKLYEGQNTKGIYSMIEDGKMLNEIKAIGKLLFYDPILSKNNERSCASCHNPSQFFTDNTTKTNLQYDGFSRLARNTPSLVNVTFNHLIMADGKHYTLQNQTKDVLTEPTEMNADDKEIVEKVMNCDEYRAFFEKILPLTPEESTVTLEHLTSAISFYYGDFSQYYSPFDGAFNERKTVEKQVQRGFNLFMSKAECATCHFVPNFNGVKPPYIGSEFEVLGTPNDKNYTALSADKGRYNINPAEETMRAFRTGSIRNSSFTAPYMHNGVFDTLDEVIDFYDKGGGQGRGLDVPNQTLSGEKLNLTAKEKQDLLAFMRSLDEKVPLPKMPEKLPLSKDLSLNNRKIGGKY